LLEKYIHHILHDHQTNLTARHHIHITRQTLAELAISASIDPSTHALMITLPSVSSLTNHPTTYEISTIYFRASYTPSDFPAPSYYDTRFLLERSRAIEFPSDCSTQVARKSRKHSRTVACSNTSWGTRVRYGVQTQSISLRTQHTSVVLGWECGRSTRKMAMLLLRLTTTSLVHQLQDKKANYLGIASRV
jgi:hypothetical protein